MVIPGGFAVRPESLLCFAFFPQWTLLVIKTFNIMPFFTFRIDNMGYPVKYPRIFQSQCLHVSQMCLIRVISVRIWIQTNLSPKLDNVRDRHTRYMRFPVHGRILIVHCSGNGM